MALTFGAATSDKIDAGSASQLDDVRTGTAVAWVYPTTNSGGERVWQKSNYGNSGPTMYLLSGGGFEAYIHRNTSDLYVSTGASASEFSTNEWVFMAWVFDENGANSDQKLFIGKLDSIVAEVGSYSSQGAGSGSFDSNASQPMYVGNGWGTDEDDKPFVGDYGFFGLWNRALTLGELRALQFQPRVTNGCLVFYDMGRSGTSTQVDWSGNGNNGTITGTTMANHIPLFVPSLPIFVTPSQAASTVSSSFTGDAVIQKNVSGSYTADAIIEKAIASSISADAAILKTQNASITGDSVIQKTQAASISGDAVIEVSVAGSLSADAVIKLTQAASFTAAAVVQKAIASSISADSVIEKTVATSFTADAYIQVAGTVSGSITADAVLKKNQASTFTVDAVIQETQAASFAADAVLKKTQASSITGDAAIFKTTSSTLLVDAVIQDNQTGTISADSVIQVTQAASITADAFLLALAGGTFTVDAVIKKTAANSFTANARIISSDIPDGIVTITATGSKPTISFTGAKPTISFTGKG